MPLVLGSSSDSDKVMGALAAAGSGSAQAHTPVRLLPWPAGLLKSPQEGTPAAERVLSLWVHWGPPLVLLTSQDGN